MKKCDVREAGLWAKTLATYWESRARFLTPLGQSWSVGKKGDFSQVLTLQFHTRIHGTM